MSSQVRLVLTIHNHQPVGNFDGVFAEAFDDSYQPFLDAFERFPHVKFSLHTSGSLIEWLVEHRPEYIDRVRDFVARGQIEILGGPFYEPILACIPRHDRVGQIQLYRSYLKSLFGTEIRGMWVPERVWEPSFTSDVADGGIEYTIVDDSHFKSAGFTTEELYGYFLTEDQGRLLKMFPISERTRYLIPFAEPHETIEFLKDVGERHPNAVVAFGDDGEKFGSWPGTKEHVYHNGWLNRFLELLTENTDWLRTCTLGEAVRQIPPKGKCYLPNASYREMTEWALPTDRQRALLKLRSDLEDDPNWPRISEFVRAGDWRNFLVKYPESNEMYARMLEISRRIQDIETSGEPIDRPDLLNQARTALYRGQCNCPYWHGAFGGLYLPHLRNAIYQQLIEADSLLDQLEGKGTKWLAIEAGDYNLDARQEIKLAGHRLNVFVAPARGGHIYECDLKAIRHNVLATMNRRPEPYHADIIEHLERGEQNGEHDLSQIHNVVKFKQENIGGKIAFDAWPRKCLVDHFLQPDPSPFDFRQGRGLVGDFVMGVYRSSLRQTEREVELTMLRTGKVESDQVTAHKTIRLAVDHPSTLQISYRFEGLQPGKTYHFGVECNFAGLPSGADDRYFYNGDGQRLGQLQTELDLVDASRIGMVDEWLGLDVGLDFSEPTSVWTFPIESVSQSEGGFELVHQSVMTMPHWQWVADQEGTREFSFQINFDTSAAQARALAEAESQRQLTPAAT